MFIQQLDDAGIRLVTSASDLSAASACEFAFLRRVDARLGRDIDVPADDDPMLARAAGLGDAHEERMLHQYRASYGVGEVGAPDGVVEIPRPNSMSAHDLSEVAEQSLSALRGGSEVVFQATFFDAQQRPGTSIDPPIGFVGFADFLRRLPNGEYEVQDTKLARRARVTALMQLAAYAEQLERAEVPVAAEAVLILGDGTRSRHRVADIAPVFRARRERLHRILLDRVAHRGPDGARRTAEPIRWGESGIAACGRCEVCGPEIELVRDPLLIAGLRATQRDRLLEAGLTTIDAVAELGMTSGMTGAPQPAVEGISAAVLERIVLQAQMQLASTSSAIPQFRVVDSTAFNALPLPNEGDLFFDFEGDPLYREPIDDDAARWGIDYLFGMVDTAERFTPIWAYDLTEERQALEAFIAMVRERRRQYPGMRIYHYAAYERTHLTSLAARHGVCEADVDELLREHVLVDLYPIVRRSMRVGTRSYSIKKLEPIYMGDELRDEEGVTSGGESVTAYAEASALLASESAEQRAEGQRRLDSIADYNRYDCVSTLRLRDWLLGIAGEHGVHPAAAADVAAGTDDNAGPELELSPLGAELALLSERADDPRDQRAAALAGSAIDYYQREQKSFWWEHYARLVDPIEEWGDARGVIVIDRLRSNAGVGWIEPEGRQRKPRRRLRLHGSIAPGSSLKPDSDAFLLYDYPPPFEQRPGAAPASRGTRLVKIIERFEDGVLVEETRDADTAEYAVLPVALTPGPPPRPGAQKPAIEEWGAQLAAALDQGEFLADPVVDLMRREPPRLRSDTELIDPQSAEARAVGGSEDARSMGAVVASVRLLDRSALAVQGPPGTGKTYLAARVIRTLVERDGWHVGVVAGSHQVVDHLLTGVVAAGLDPARVAKVPQGGRLDAETEPPAFTVLRQNGQLAFLREHGDAGRGAVVGGTAWDFSNPARVPRKSLDLLVIDEAGQFSLAPTIAASVAAERLLLLGDPQQLPQVSQGTHPEPVDTSALAWLLGEHDTLPDEYGYFLAETRRMRPELAQVVSELAYEGRMRAHASAAQREVAGIGPAGLIWHPVEHAGNATSSPEEAAVVVDIVERALNSRLITPDTERTLQQRDVIVVAAYNAQVETVAQALADAGYDEIRVGTVDRFQGQEAVVAIVTLAASSPADVPRGLEFLLMRNRLNVAISRAQWAAHLVSSQRLGDGLPLSTEGLSALSGYLRLTELAQRAPWDR